MLLMLKVYVLIRDSHLILCRNYFKQEWNCGTLCFHSFPTSLDIFPVRVHKEDPNYALVGSVFALDAHVTYECPFVSWLLHFQSRSLLMCPGKAVGDGFHM